MIDFEKQGKEMSEAARAESARIDPSQMVRENEAEELRAPDITNGQEAVNPMNGQTNDANAPGGSDPNQPAQEPAAATAEPQAPERPDVPWVIADENFKGEHESFFKKGFFKSLSGKIDEALRGNTPEDLALSMTLASMTLLFDMLSAYLDHNRDERDRLAKGYKDGVAAFERDMHVYQQDKDLTIWTTLGNDPEFKQRFGNKGLTADVKKEALKYIKNNPELKKTLADAYSFLTKHECKDIDKQIKKTFGMDTQNRTIEQIAGLGLQDTRIVEASANAKKLSEYRGNLRSYEARRRQLEENRRILNRARGRGTQNRQQQRQQQQQQTR